MNLNFVDIMWVKQCHKPPIFLGMVNIPPTKMVIWGMVYGIVSTHYFEIEMRLCRKMKAVPNVVQEPAVR
jgi:hypothetical protein